MSSLYPKTSVVICALNEEKNIPLVLTTIPPWVYEIIIVDGHSTDNTVTIAKTIRPDVKIVVQQHKGKGDALKYGVSHSKGDLIVTLDADGTYLSEEMAAFIKPLTEGYDFAKGTRFNGQKLDCMPPNRRLGNRILALTSNILFHTKYTDICSGYYSFRKTLFTEINLVSDGFEMEQELFVKLRKMGYTVTEVPHSYRSRLYGASKTKDFRQGFKDLLWLFTLFFTTKNA